MKETEGIELQELNKLNEVEDWSDEEIKKRKKWIEDAEKSGRIFLICLESFVVISIVLLVALAAVSYEKNWLSPCIEIKSESGDVTCKTANFAFGFSAKNGDEPPATVANPGNIDRQMLSCPTSGVKFCSIICFYPWHCEQNSYQSQV